MKEDKYLKSKMLSHVSYKIEERKDYPFHSVMQYSYRNGWNDSQADQWISVEDRLPPIDCDVYKDSSK